MKKQVFNNKLLLALTKDDLSKILKNLAELYIWEIKEIRSALMPTPATNYVISILDLQENLMEEYRYTVENDKKLFIEIMIYTNTKIVNLPFYFLLFLYHDTISNYVIKYYIIYQKTSIDALKKFHNEVKRNHLREVINKLKKTGTSEKNISLLDLCSGKGNDTTKWHSLGIHNVVGVDISEDNINEARYRFLEKNYSSNFNVTFRQSDVGIPDRELNSFLEHYIAANHGRKFDIVSCNFAIHYMFKFPDCLNNFMSIIKKYLKPGGYFIGTTLNKENIMALFKHSEKIHQSPLLEIVPQANFFNESMIYGRKYGIRIGLKGENTYFSKDESVEYLVDFNELRSCANRYGLLMTDFSNFKMLYSGNSLSREEKTPSFLNSKFTFYKHH